jgi:hypothetical protein
LNKQVKYTAWIFLMHDIVGIGSAPQCGSKIWINPSPDRYKCRSLQVTGYDKIKSPPKYIGAFPQEDIDKIERIFLKKEKEQFFRELNVESYKTYIANTDEALDSNEAYYSEETDGKCDDSHLEYE